VCVIYTYSSIYLSIYIFIYTHTHTHTHTHIYIYIYTSVFASAAASAQLSFRAIVAKSSPTCSEFRVSCSGSTVSGAISHPASLSGDDACFVVSQKGVLPTRLISALMPSGHYNTLGRSGPNLKPGTVCVCGTSGLRKGMPTTQHPPSSASRAGTDLHTNVQAVSRAVSYVHTHRPRFQVRARPS